MINFKRVNSDTNGNPRYVFHFLAIASTYEEALRLVKTRFTARKFNNKQFGGGIVIQSYNINEDSKILESLKTN